MTESFDSQIQWFHDLAAKSVDKLARSLTHDARESFSAFVSMCLPQHKLPPDLSAQELAEHIHVLRNNERKWNQALMMALIRADDLFKSGSVAEAGRSLDEFAMQCPWAHYQQVARDQQSNYG